MLLQHDIPKFVFSCGLDASTLFDCVIAVIVQYGLHWHTHTAEASLLVSEDVSWHRMYIMKTVYYSITS